MRYVCEGGHRSTYAMFLRVSKRIGAPNTFVHCEGVLQKETGRHAFIRMKFSELAATSKTYSKKKSGEKGRGKHVTVSDVDFQKGTTR